MNRTDAYIEQLKIDEGFSSELYRCPTGHLTIGYGFNLEAGISEELAEVILRHQYQDVWKQCNKEFPEWWFKLSNDRRDVVVNMVFNLGLEGFKKFKRMIACLSIGDYDGASNEMLDSKWAKQVKGRAIRLSEEMRGEA